ncbi:MAG: anhydro-N-acetylmuramic acid kinase, partial [Caulobacteraceae bacterium]|nr:anhydro-N-acetylmuramic acid kinase [Caulobacter sp.]
MGWNVIGGAVSTPAMRVLGFMSGTSLDAIDMAVIETDGETVAAFGPAGEAPLPEPLRERVLDAVEAGRRWARGAPEPNSFAELEGAVADAHFEAADVFLEAHGLAWSDIDLIGFHGQTVLHEQPQGGVHGRTRQLGDGAWLARRAGVPVAFDFRSADVAAGGHGAPLAPVYHQALLARAGLPPPSAVLNIGGVANLTLSDAAGAITALDTGPGNGLLDLWAERHGRGRFDAGGALARAGRIDAAALQRLMAHPYLRQPAPKSLDRYDFDLAPVEGLSAEDGAATLTAFTAEAVALALRQAGWSGAAVIVAGGGRRNPALLSELGLRVRRPILVAEALGWRGDAVEAELFAFLAA